MIDLRDHLSDSHLRASRMLARALHAKDAEIWIDADTVWRATLSDAERASLAYSVLKSLDPDHQRFVVETVCQVMGMPLPPLLDAAHEAGSWAAFADEEQLRATALACFNAMSASDQSAFLSHVSRRAA